MRVAVFGGSFDPPHYGHVLVLTQILNSAAADAIWLVPAGNDRYDKVPTAAAAHRLAMLRLLMQDEFQNDERVHLEIAQLEGKLPGSKAIELLEYCKTKLPEAEFIFVIGADNVRQLSSWHRAEELLANYTFIVAARLGEEFPLESSAGLIKLESGFSNNYASSDVRALLKGGGLTSGIVPKIILDYITKHHLYR